MFVNFLGLKMATVGDTPFTPIAIIIKSIKTYMRKSDSIKLHRTAADPREKTENRKNSISSREILLLWPEWRGIKIR